jgi:hypothetical protein
VLGLTPGQAECGWLSWLLQRERDGGADEVEGLALFAGGLGEHGHGGGSATDEI